ncbi:AAA family ATPase [Pseudomonas sp. L1(2025)]|uniref:AAA family ATPase n=1 Tax=Pseudomonas sp. L1(2025) TaxID=3449429 RepID=UPI003F6949BE
MASGKILRQLIKAGTAGNKDDFHRASEAIIEEERQKQHHLLANDLEKILYSSSSPMVLPSSSRLIGPVPVDKERGLPLLDISTPKRSLDELVLPKNKIGMIEEFLEEHRRSDVLRSYGMQPSNKVIFFGPPGCGKTLTAEIIAFELDMPLAVVRLDTLVSSYLGETATNLRKIFDYISSTPLIVLFDEFDALGKERSDNSDHGELRRVVNAVLQMIDSYDGKSIIVAATNHEHILDSAIWRRFDDSIEFGLPNKETITKILKLKLRGVRRQFEVDIPEIIELFENLSGADIERICRRAIKRMILRNNEFLSINDIEHAKDRESRQ